MLIRSSSSGCRPAGFRVSSSARDRHQTARSVVPSRSRCRERRARPEGPIGVRRGGQRCVAGLQPRIGYGRNGVHRNPQGRLHDFSPDQHEHVDRGTRCRSRTVLLLIVRVRICGRQADPARRRSAQRSRRLPGDARGRLRVGEAVWRAHVPAFLRRFRP